MLRPKPLLRTTILAAVALAVLSGVSCAATVRIALIEVTGNAEVTAQTVTDAIKGVLREGQDVPDLRAALSAAREALLARGYFDEVLITAEPVDGGQKVSIAVRERPTVKDVVFVGNTLLTDEQLRAIVRTAPGRVVNPGVARIDSDRIQVAYQERGGFATVTHADASEDGVVTFVIQEAHLESVRFAGLHVVRADEALAACGLQVGALFAQAEVLAAVRALRETGWFEQVTPRPSPGEDDATDAIMVFDVVETAGVFPDRVGRPKDGIDPAKLRAAVPGPELMLATSFPWPLEPAVVDAEPDVVSALASLAAEAAAARQRGASSEDAAAMMRYADLLAAVGRAGEAGQQYEAAAELCQLLLQTGAGDRFTPCVLGRCLAATGKLTEAVAAFEQAMGAREESWEPHAAFAATVVAAMHRQAQSAGSEASSRPSAVAMAELLPLDETRKALLASFGSADGPDPWRALAVSARGHLQTAWRLAPGAPEVARLRSGASVAGLFGSVGALKSASDVLQMAAQEARSAPACLVTAADYDPYVAACLVLLEHPVAVAAAARQPAAFGPDAKSAVEAFGRDLSDLATREPAVMRAYGAALGWVRLALEMEHAQAREAFEATLAGNPYDEAAYIGLLQVTVMGENWAQAAAEVERRLSLVSSPRDLTILATCYLRAGRPEADILAVFDRAIAAHPQSPLGYFGRAGALLRGGATVDQVQAALEPGLALAPEDAYAGCLQCVVHLLDGKPATAARALKSALAANPRSPLANALRRDFFDANA